MRSQLRLSLLIGCLLIIFVTVSGNVNGATDDRDTLEKLIEQTKQQISQQKKREKSVLGNLQQQQQELDTLENNYDHLKGKLSIVQNNYESTRQEQRRLENNLGHLKHNLSSRQQRLNRRLIAVYKYGPQSFLEIVINAQSFMDLISRFSTISYFVKDDVSSIAEIQSLKVQVDFKQKKVGEKKKQVETELQKIKVVKEQVFDAHQKVATKVRTTKEELSQIQSDQAQLEKALEEYEKTSKEIGSQIVKTEKDRPEGALGTGKMIWPVKGWLSSPFGWRYHPVLKVKKYHNGQDIAVPEGTPVHAADSGIVVVSGWEGGYGNYVAIDHGNGISTGYGHNSRLLVHVGERVTKGQVISLSGSTGLSTGPHVHFEVRRNGVPVDPIPFLP